MNFKYGLFITLFMALLGSIRGNVRLPKLFSDGLVIQREAEVKVWGWADKGENIEVIFKGKEYKAKADKNGNWSITLAPSKAGGPYILSVKGDNQLTIENILVGDVWLCSGQSNMVHAFNRYTTIYPEEIRSSTNDQIRQFLVPTSTNLVGPQKDLNGGQWKAASPENLLDFSVVAYFMAKEIQEKVGVPIGIINASVGGTPIEAWMGERAYIGFEDLLQKIQDNKDTAKVNGINREAAAIRRKQFANPPVDLGLEGEKRWFDTDYKPVNWKNISIPGYWEDQGVRDLDGIVWFRREIELPKSMTETDAFVEMGRIIDADEFYINGQKIGNTTYQYPPRRYSIPKGILKEGKNILVVRVTNNFGKGGFVPDKPYFIRANNQEIDLKGDWQYKVGTVFDRRGQESPGSISLQNQPTSLYNAMIAPYTDFALKGVCWYQGESNSGRPGEYDELLTTFVNSWRADFKDANLPVIVIQLPNFMEVNYLPEESNWAKMREAQSEVLKLENTELVCTIDLGEWNDIHPMNKKTVGMRAGLVARHLVYGENIVYSGPVIKTAELVGDELILTFDHVGGGLTISGSHERLGHFSVAGEDGQFLWVDGKIEEDTVVLKVANIEDPQVVRYAWADNPDFANLANQDGLPARPFQIKIVAQ